MNEQKPPKTEAFLIPIEGRLRRLNHFAGLEAAGANTDALVGAIYARAHGAQVHIPAPAAHVVRVADLVSKLRAFAADITNLCHVGNSRISHSEKAVSFSRALVDKDRFYMKLGGKIKLLARLGNGSIALSFGILPIDPAVIEKLSNVPAI